MTGMRAPAKLLSMGLKEGAFAARAAEGRRRGACVMLRATGVPTGGFRCAWCATST